MKEQLRHLPKVDEIINTPTVKPYYDELGHQVTVNLVRQAIEQVRQLILSGKELADVKQMVMDLILKALRRAGRPHLRRVLNGTGTILHTNLGRALLSEAAKQQILSIADSYSNLEYDLEKGQRGLRYDHVTDLLKEITGAEDALVVNNNAAAVLLALSSLAKGREAIVSRGQLIEIGGSFRVPDVMKQSGAMLKEVGTTNKTHLRDYVGAINENTALILKVHTSNYRIVGFTKEVATKELVDTAHQHAIPVLEDLGSGVLLNMQHFGLSYEPTVQEVVAAGVDVVTFSGDKLLGGPQAGIIVGKEKYIKIMRKNQLNRALRIDKLTLAALEATLKLYFDEQKAIQSIPTLRMIAVKQEELLERAEKIYQKLRLLSADKAEVRVEKTLSQMGGGALPLETIPSAGIALIPRQLHVNRLEKSLRQGDLPVIARIERQKLIIDLRTIAPRDDDLLCQAILDVFKEN